MRETTHAAADAGTCRWRLTNVAAEKHFSDAATSQRLQRALQLAKVFDGCPKRECQ
jgi:hypothetical protein